MKEKKVPMRQCVGCRESKEKKILIRIVKEKDQTISIDRTGKKNGRGAYLCDDLECLKKARKNRGLNRAFRMEIDDVIYDELERQLLNESK
ncbi:MAG: YlxR family protein [Clostridiales bacterium]|nr:YlxR family protein [Clostridiales bacterium]